MITLSSSNDVTTNLFVAYLQEQAYQKIDSYLLTYLWIAVGDTAVTSNYHYFLEGVCFWFTMRYYIKLQP